MTREELINEVIRLEWGMFTATQNNGGRASCQDDWPTFEIMRRSQHMIWAMDTLDSYRADLREAMGRGENLVAFKYGYMMRVTYPEEYEVIKVMLPPITHEKTDIVDEIAQMHAVWAQEKAEKYPLVSGMGRPQTSQQGGRWAAIDNYLYTCSLEGIPDLRQYHHRRNSIRHSAMVVAYDNCFRADLSTGNSITDT